jgi:hypothetical protein
MNQENGDDSPLVLLAETENYAVLLGDDADSEPIYNVELGSVTLHLFREEWDELVSLITQAAKA